MRRFSRFSSWITRRQRGITYLPTVHARRRRRRLESDAFLSLFPCLDMGLFLRGHRELLLHPLDHLPEFILIRPPTHQLMNSIRTSESHGPPAQPASRSLRNLLTMPPLPKELVQIKPTLTLATSPAKPFQGSSPFVCPSPALLGSRVVPHRRAHPWTRGGVTGRATRRLLPVAGRSLSAPWRIGETSGNIVCGLLGGTGASCILSSV